MIVSVVEPQPIYLPRIRVTREPCAARSGGLFGYHCTRPEGHTGRHAAAGSDNRLCHVWPDVPVSEPCS